MLCQFDFYDSLGCFWPWNVEYHWPFNVRKQLVGARCGRYETSILVLDSCLVQRYYLKTWNQGDMKLRRIGRDRLNFMSPLFHEALVVVQKQEIRLVDWPRSAVMNSQSRWNMLLCIFNTLRFGEILKWSGIYQERAVFRAIGYVNDCGRRES